jgi:hypothetical protein
MAERGVLIVVRLFNCGSSPQRTCRQIAVEKNYGFSARDPAQEDDNDTGFGQAK